MCIININNIINNNNVILMCVMCNNNVYIMCINVIIMWNIIEICNIIN